MRLRTVATLVLCVAAAGFAWQGRASAQLRSAGQAPRTASPKEEVDQAETLVGRITAARATVRRQLEQARAQRDVVKSLCLNDKLSQLDVAVRSAEERKEAVVAASNRQDRDLARHEGTILAVLKQRTDQLLTESNQCIGKEAGMVGESAVSSAIDPNLPQEDSPQQSAPAIPVQVVQPPACQSCFE